MFEDSTFESTGRIRTRSRRWMLAAFALNASILIALIVIPLIRPDALPRIDIAHLIAVPPAISQPRPIVRAEHPAPTSSRVDFEPLRPPQYVPTRLPPNDAEPAPQGIDPSQMANGSPDGIIGSDNPFNTHRLPAVVQQAPAKPLRISTATLGEPISRMLPVYPPIAIASKQEGTVILQAVISKSGTIENLHVLNGPPMLRQAALDAVAQWRYRPYTLNGQPIEVETTINVVFTLAR
jgi:protein TonB